MMTKLEIRPWMFLKSSILDFQQVLRDAFKTQSKIYMVGTPPVPPPPFKKGEGRRFSKMPIMGVGRGGGESNTIVVNYESVEK